jgi:phosphoribosylformimino-5-aminoimidazole carboxamide ribonucleotide (ProFAR) isomerase
VNLYQSDDWLIKIAVKDSDGVAVDLTASTLQFNLSTKLNRTAQITQTMTITDAVNGLAEVLISSTETEGTCTGLNYISITKDQASIFKTIYQAQVQIYQVIK